MGGGWSSNYSSSLSLSSSSTNLSSFLLSLSSSPSSSSSSSSSKPLKLINKRFLSIISSYCPNLILSLLSLNHLSVPISYPITGACLLADICGFTKFSGDLCQEGVTGIDKLRRTTSTFLTKFIDTVYFYYGDGKLDFFLSTHPPDTLIFLILIHLLILRLTPSLIFLNQSNCICW